MTQKVDLYIKLFSTLSGVRWYLTIIILRHPTMFLCLVAYNSLQ